MKKAMCLSAVLVLFLTGAFAQNQKTQIEASIIHFFDGFSEVNIDKLKKYSTTDLLLLENGAVWDLDTLVNKFNARKNSGIRRINKFQFIDTQQTHHTAWVSYYNTAEFTTNDKHQTVRWLESAVLEKKKGIWKIRLLHSTNLK